MKVGNNFEEIVQIWCSGPASPRSVKIKWKFYLRLHKSANPNSSLRDVIHEWFLRVAILKNIAGYYIDICSMNDKKNYFSPDQFCT